MLMNLPVAPKSMRVTISSGELLPTAWICSGISVLLWCVIEWMRRGGRQAGWCEDSWGTACSVLSSLALDCGFNISLVDHTVLVSNTEKLSVKWGMGVTVDWC